MSMRLFAPLALAGISLAVIQPTPRTQDSGEKTERAIAAIKELGGKVEVDTKSPGTPVVGVNLKHTKVVDASLEHLKGLTRLEVLTDLEALELGRTKVTDKGLEHLKGFLKLRTLDLGGTQVTDDGLRRLK